MSHQSAVVHFAKIYSELSPQVFYAFRAYRGLLDEVSLATLPRAAA
jgi:hypothetical protein